MSVQQQQHHCHDQRAACMITIVHTVPPLFVETTQAEFRAVVQRLTAGGRSNNNNSQTLDADHDNSPSSISQTEARVPKSPINIAAADCRRPRRRDCSRLDVPRSRSSESLCNTSNGAASQDSSECGGHLAADQSTVIRDGDDAHYSAMYDAAPPSCSKKIKLHMSRPAHVYQNGVQESGNTQYGATPLPHLPSSLSSSCSSRPPLHPCCLPVSPRRDRYLYQCPFPASGGSASPATGKPAVISHTTGQLKAVSHGENDHNDGYDADDYFPWAFYCEPASPPPLLDIIVDELQNGNHLLP